MVDDPPPPVYRADLGTDPTRLIELVRPHPWRDGDPMQATCLACGATWIETTPVVHPCDAPARRLRQAEG